MWAGFAGILAGLLIGVGHNTLHQKENHRRWYMDMTCMSSRDFKIHHAISHHAHTNTINDYELSMMEPVLQFFPSPYNASPEGQDDRGNVSMNRMLTAFFGMPYAFLERLGLIATGNWDGNLQEHLSHGIVGMQFVLFYLLSQSASVAMQLWLCMHVTCSSFFIFSNFTQGPHYSQEAWHQGDKLDSRDWGIMQVQSVVSGPPHTLAQNMFYRLLAISEFEQHHLHHLFPTIDHSYLVDLLPIFEEVCKEFGVVYSRKADLEEVKAGVEKCLAGAAPNQRTLNGQISSKI